MPKAIFVIDEDEVPVVENVMFDIKAKDETFRYKIGKSKYEKGKYVLIVYGSCVDEVHKKAMWIRDKVFGNDRLYWVK